MKVTIVDRQASEHEIDVAPGRSLMEVLRDLDYGVAAICGGLCACATCHVYIASKWMPQLPLRSREELDLLEELGDYDPERSRLSCQVSLTDALSGLSLTIGPE